MSVRRLHHAAVWLRTLLLPLLLTAALLPGVRAGGEQQAGCPQPPQATQTTATQTTGGQTTATQTTGGQTTGGQTAGGQTAGGQTAGGQTDAEPQFLRDGWQRLRAIEFPAQDFTFVRIKYSTGTARFARWATDYPAADRALSQRLSAKTSLKVHPSGIVRTLVDDDLRTYPLIYLSEPGSLTLSVAEVVALRTYLNAGGFLLADDFWGEVEWANFRAQIKRAFPDLKPVDLPLSHPIFQTPFRLSAKPQVCSIAMAIRGRAEGITWERPDAKEPHYWGLVDDRKRLMAVFCHNTDLADGWERHAADTWYAREFSERRAFPMGINIITHALTRRRGETPAERPERR